MSAYDALLGAVNEEGVHWILMVYILKFKQTTFSWLEKRKLSTKDEQ